MKFFTALVFAFTILLASITSVFAQMPSEAEMRAQLQAAGMTPSQIDKALASMREMMPLNAPAGDLAVSNDVCIDENENDVCDDEENDPDMTTCRTVYLNIIEKVALERYGTRLGVRAARIGQTCSMAAVGGSLRFGHGDIDREERGGQDDKGWYFDTDELTEIADYWQAVMSYSRYLYPSDEEIEAYADLYDLDDIDSIIGQLPSDLRIMLRSIYRNRSGDTGILVSTALPVHRRCERIRKQVGHRFRNTVHHRTICVPDAPQPVEIADPDGEE